MWNTYASRIRFPLNVGAGELPEYWTSGNLGRGALLGAAALVCFYLGQDDLDDEFRFAHGLSHVFGGLALTFLWNLPRRKMRNEDADMPLKPKACV